MPDSAPGPAPDRSHDYKQALRVGGCHVDPGALLVRCGEREARLTPKAMAVLLELARQPGVTVSRDELLDRVWGSTFITPGVVGHAITALRRAFGDALQQPKFIETIPRIGYRLLATVEREPVPSDPAPGNGAGARAVATGAATATTTGEVATGATSSAPVALATGAAPAAAHAPDTTTPARQPATAPLPRRRTFRRVLAVLALLTVLGVVAAAWRPWQDVSRDDQALTVESARRLTFDPGSETSARLDATGDWLVYTRRDAVGSPPRLLLQSAHGTGTIELAPDDHAERPAWAPDGRRVAYVRRGDGRCRLSIAHLDDKLRRDIADCPGNSVVYLDWNPVDGRSIAYSAVAPGQAGGSRIRLLGEQSGWAPLPLRYARTPASPDLDPRFSPDGNRIAFRRGSNPNSDLYLMRADGGAVERLTTARSTISGFDWLPDGSGLVFSSDHHGRRDLYLLRLSDRSIRALGVPDASYPDIAARGWRMSYQIDDWQSSLSQVSLSGAPARALAPSSGRDGASALSPDGRRVIFVSDRDGSSQLWSLDTASGAVERLTRHRDVRVDLPAFSPDGSHVVYATRAEGRHELWEYRFREGAARRVHALPASLLDVAYGGDGRTLWYVAWQGEHMALHACRRRDDGGCSGGATRHSALRVERTVLDGRSVLLLASPTASGGLDVVAEHDLRLLRRIPLPPSNAWTAVAGEIWSLRPGAGDDATTLVATSLRDGSIRMRQPLPGLRPLGLMPFEVTPDRQHLVLPTVTGNSTDLGIARLRAPRPRG